MDINDQNILRAIETNSVDHVLYWCHWPRMRRVEHRHAIVTESDLPCPFFNNVFSALIPESEAQDVANALIDRFCSRNVPCFWWSGPANHDQQVASILETRGFVKAVEGAAMAIDLSNCPNFNSGTVEICEVECASQMSDWCSTCTAAFEFDDALSGWWHELFTSIPHGSPSPLTHFLAAIDGEPVGTASAFVEDGVVGLASVGVRSEHRRRGIGSAITLAALDAARNLGSRLGVLFSSPMAVAMYEGLGFRQYGTGHCYMWSPGDGEVETNH
jgi:GNAT superfamily N-acetyltransferase